jgi:hypothetical protein
MFASRALGEAIVGLGVMSALFVLPAIATAHGPSPLKAVEKVSIAAPADKVWATIGNFQDMSWHPSIAKTDGAGGNEPGKGRRSLTLKQGGMIEETLSKYSEADMVYGYHMEKVDTKILPVSGYSSQIIVTPTSPGQSEVEWRGAFYRASGNESQPAPTDIETIKAVSDIYRAGLDALKVRFEKMN